MIPLPGADLIADGLADVQSGRRTIAACLVSIGAPRLRRLGIPVDHPIPEPETALYHLLAEQGADSAHGRYNGYLRRLVSFERASHAIAGRS